jgi:regulator of RNase E activity RraA/catechol 2,3-dioxygenase-like lactoylglutathione lyase family enzyme
MNVYDELARIGVATVYEASGREGLIDVELRALVAGARVAGPARTVLCGQDDNLMVHAAIERIRPGEIVVIAMPRPSPVALIGELLITQMRTRGAAGVLCEGAARDVEELTSIGLPVWTRYVRARGATKNVRGTLDAPIRIGDASIAPGDAVLLDADGACVVAAARERAAREAAARERYAAGVLSYDANDLRRLVEAPPETAAVADAASSGAGARDVESLKRYVPPPGIPFRLEKIGHIVINVADLERSVAFYTQILGFRVSDVYPDAMVPGGMVFMRFHHDHHGVALVGCKPGDAQTGGRVNGDLNHFAFAVSTLDQVLQARAHLRATGTPILFEGRRRAGCQLAVEFLDPDGNNLEIYTLLDQVGSDGIVRPAQEWSQALTLEEAIAHPARGQDVSVTRSDLLER